MDTMGVLAQGQLGGSGPELLYVVPFDFAATIRDMEFINLDPDAPATVTLWMVPTGEVVDDQWIVRPPTEIEGGGSLPWEGSRTLGSEYEIHAESADGPVNIIITGMEVDLTPTPT